ncbi:hypothetical protein PAXRUDRAFT_172110, partial [Paxillus rubicundulus Ve08.2h10]
LFNASVPVWLVCSDEHIPPDMNIKKLVLFTYPDHIIKPMYHKVSATVCPFKCIYSGPGGIFCHVHTHHTYPGKRKIPHRSWTPAWPLHSGCNIINLTTTPRWQGETIDLHTKMRNFVYSKSRTLPDSILYISVPSAICLIRLYTPVDILLASQYKLYIH